MNNHNSANEEELKSQAEAVLVRLREEGDREEPPCFVEFAGTPKSGKSSCIDIVSHFFRRLGFRVHAPTEGASKRTPYYLKQDLVAYNASCASYALSHILEGVYGSDRFDLAILDRGLFDSLAWFEILSRQGKISPADCNVISSFLMLDNWRQYINQVFLFKADEETSLKREYENKLIDEPGVAMNTEFLASLNEAYEAVQKVYSTSLPKLRVIDTSLVQKTSPKSTALEVAQDITKLIESRLT